MRNGLKVALISVLVASTSAHATSFANRGLGLGLGFMRIFSDDASVPDFAVPLWIEGSMYIESGFEAYLRVPIALANVRIGAGTPSGEGLVFASGGQFGLRYLFLEETLRPYVFLHLSGIYVARAVQMNVSVGSNALIGPGLGGGVEYFVSDSISLQARGFVDWFVGINCGSSNCQRFNVGGTLTGSTYF